MRFFLSSTFLSKLLLYCFLAYSSFSFSQEKDSLDQYSFPELNLKFNKSLYESSKLARLYVEKMLHNGIKEEDNFKIAWSYNNLANLENLIGNTQQSLDYIDKAITITAENSEDTEEDKAFQIQLIYTKGHILFGKGDYEKAFEAYNINYEYYKDTGNQYMMNSVAYNMAIMKNNLGNHSGAIKTLLKSYNSYLNTSIEDRKKEFSEDFCTNTLVAITDAFIKKAIKYPKRKSILLDSASTYNTIGFKNLKEINNNVGTISFVITRAIIKEEREKYKEAIFDLDLSLESIKEYNQPNLLTAVYYHKGLCYNKLKQFDNAISYLKKVDSVSQKNSTNYIILQKAYYTLAKIYTKQKDFVNASKYYELHVKNDSINDRLTEIVRKYIHERHDMDGLKDEIEDLNYEIDNKNLKAITIISLLTIALCVFFIFYRRQKLRNKVAFEKLLKELENKNQSETINTKSSSSKVITIDDEKVSQVLKALEKFEEKEWFLNKNCDLAFVAKKVKTNKTYLSKIIHTHKQLKFIDYIRNLRIDYALQRLKDDPIFRSYDIKSIAEESGFKSSDLFSRAFVKNTSIYPSYYIKNINKTSS